MVRIRLLEVRIMGKKWSHSMDPVVMVSECDQGVL
jgi:hypothetical protein